MLFPNLFMQHKLLLVFTHWCFVYRGFQKQLKLLYQWLRVVGLLQLKVQLMLSLFQEDLIHLLWICSLRSVIVFFCCSLSMPAFFLYRIYVVNFIGAGFWCCWCWSWIPWFSQKQPTGTIIIFPSDIVYIPKCICYPILMKLLKVSFFAFQFQALRSMVQANPQILQVNCDFFLLCFFGCFWYILALQLVLFFFFFFYLQPMLQELGKQNPHLLRTIQEHHQEFLQLINEPVDGSEGWVFQACSLLSVSFDVLCIYADHCISKCCIC